MDFRSEEPETDEDDEELNSEEEAAIYSAVHHGGEDQPAASGESSSSSRSSSSLSATPNVCFILLAVNLVFCRCLQRVNTASTLWRSTIPQRAQAKTAKTKKILS